jgi:hypothetical protein
MMDDSEIEDRIERGITVGKVLRIRHQKKHLVLPQPAASLKSQINHCRINVNGVNPSGKECSGYEF